MITLSYGALHVYFASPRQNFEVFNNFGADPADLFGFDTIMLLIN